MLRFSSCMLGDEDCWLERGDHGWGWIMGLGTRREKNPEQGSFFIPAAVTSILLLLVLFVIMSGGNAGGQRHTHGTRVDRHLLRAEDLKRNQTCPQSWQQGPAGARCFLLVNSSSSWELAEVSCRKRGGHLASLSSQPEALFIQRVCQSSFSGPCWVGARESNSGTWMWTDCRVQWNVSGSLLGPINCTNTSSICAQQHCLSVSNTSPEPLLRESCSANHPYVCVLTEGSECPGSTNRKTYLIVLVAVSCLILAMTLSIVIWLLVHRRTKRKRRRRSSASSSLSLEPPASFRLFKAEELKIATNSFSMENRLRGSAFRGILSDGSRVVVKKLERTSFQGREEFMGEMNRVARLRHPNLVTMLGCCYDHGERYIVYEFISNGPLDHWLHDPVRRGTLDWRTRMRIAITAAQGIAYLHDQVKPHVIHRDIKASSILLDESFSGHLMGVGLTSIVPWEAAYERTVVAGTHGYLAPEFVYRNELTTKSDVYSFGVVMLELISGRKPAMPVDVVDWQTIFEWATPLVQSQRVMEIVDPEMPVLPGVNQVQKLVDLIYSCTQHVPSMRPRMAYVVHQLQLVDADAAEQQHQTMSGAGAGASAASSSSSRPAPAVYNASRSGEPALISVQSEIIESLF